MRSLVVLVLALVALAAAELRIPQRIVGGSHTTISNYPEMVVLLRARSGTNHVHDCGGAILNHRAVLTAAHCIVNQATSNWRVRSGSSYAHSGGNVHTISRFIPHNQYTPWTADNDMGIIHIDGTFRFDQNVQPASVAGSNYHLGDNQVVWATGWGRTAPNGQVSEQLRHVQLWTVNQSVCRDRYRQLNRVVTDNMLCSGWLGVGGRDQCQGDSGGPLYHNRVVVGVCSWGESCALARYPGVNVRVSRYSSWIQQNA